MRFILIDTADARGSVAVFADGDSLSLEAHRGQEDYSGWLLPAVQRVLSQSSLILSELDGYAVCAGPGSFTGLRVGLTTVKAWAEIYGRPIAAVSRLEAFTLSEQAAKQDLVAVYLDARREQVFAALYKRSGDRFELLGEECVTPLPQFLERVADEAPGQPVLWVSPDVDLIESLPLWRTLAAGGHRLEALAEPFAAGLGQLAYRKFSEGATTDAMALDANYVRRSDAEIFWKGNLSAVKA